LNKAKILADLWLNYRNDEDFIDFIEYNDIGLPLAYIINEGIVQSTEMAQRFIEETFDLLIEALDVSDTGFDDLDDLLSIVVDEEPEE
jgi:Asp-tRNA(Asn)/Glu-tRNA(Gln) amidotransferase B subunit